MKLTDHETNKRKKKIMKNETTFEMHETQPVCTINAYWDTESSRFECEAFTTLQSANHCGKQAVYCYEMEAPNYASEMFDFSECTAKDFRAYCIANPAWSDYDVKDVIREKVQSCYSWEEYALDQIDDRESVANIAINEELLVDNSSMRFGIVSASGSCQGDYATVLFKLGDFGDESRLHEMFSNMLYSAPAYISIDYPDGERIISEMMPDVYDYDKEAVLELVAQCAELNPYYDWIAETLPEYLDCI